MPSVVPRTLSLLHGGSMLEHWQTHREGVMLLNGSLEQRERTVGRSLEQARGLGWGTYLVADRRWYGLPARVRQAESPPEVAAMLEALRLTMGERYAEMTRGDGSVEATTDRTPILLAVHDYGDVMACLRASRDKGPRAIQDLRAIAMMGRPTAISVLLSGAGNGALDRLPGIECAAETYLKDPRSRREPGRAPGRAEGLR